MGRLTKQPARASRDTRRMPIHTDQQRGWRILDPVLRLRALDTDHIYPLPDPGQACGIVIGASAASDLRLDDPSGRLSRQHAHLACEGARWVLRDLASKNGTWVDGIRRHEAELVPGLELCLGGLTLIAESVELIRLRALVARLIGWADTRRRDVDRALRGLRDAAQLRAALVLCGEGALVPIARRLHRETLGSRPFIACAPHELALPLIELAGNGTLCLLASHPIDDALDAIDALRATGSLARLVLCAPTVQAASSIAALLGPTVWIDLPHLAARTGELRRLIAEAADDAAHELAQPITAIRDGDLGRLITIPFEGLGELHDACRRLVAVRTLGVSAGASRLGITHGALARWSRRRGIVA